MKEKNAYLISDVNQLKVPLVPELSMANIWPKAMQITDFFKYMPDDWANGHHRTDRAFFFGVLATKAPGFVEQLILDSRA